MSVEVDRLDRSKQTERRYVTDDASWCNGPPYAIVEHVFDEDSQVACSLSPDGQED